MNVVKLYSLQKCLKGAAMDKIWTNANSIYCDFYMHQVHHICVV